MKKLKTIPKFNSEAEEREFWQKVDTTEYVDYSKGIRGVRFPNLKLSTKPIIIRVEKETFKKIENKAKKLATSSEHLIEQWVSEAATR